MAPLTCSTCHRHLSSRLQSHLLTLRSLRIQGPKPSLPSRTKSTSAPSSKLSYHWDTPPPSDHQLQSASSFFETHTPRKLWTATEWRKLNDPFAETEDGHNPQSIPEVAFLGRSNVGKSSVLNALLMTPALNRVGPRPGKTTIMHAWGMVPEGARSNSVAKEANIGTQLRPSEFKGVQLSVLDMPGYGYASQGEWGQEILTYLRRRKQLKRAFVLIDALHGLKGGDLQMFRLLRDQEISYQVVVSKVDRLVGTKQGGSGALRDLFELLRDEVVQPPGRSGRPNLLGHGEILAVGGLEEGKKGQAEMGMDALRWAVLVAGGVEKYALECMGESVGQRKRRLKREAQRLAAVDPKEVDSAPAQMSRQSQHSG